MLVTVFGGKGCGRVFSSCKADTSQICNKTLESVDAVFAHLAIPCGESPGVPAERLGHAMRILGMNPSQNEAPWCQQQRKPWQPFPVVFTAFFSAFFCCFQVEKYLDQLGRPTHLNEKTFRDFSQDAAMPAMLPMMLTLQLFVLQSRPLKHCAVMCCIQLSGSQEELRKYFSRVQEGRVAHHCDTM